MIAPNNDNNRVAPLSLHERSVVIDELTAECARLLKDWQQVDVCDPVSAQAKREAYQQANSNLYVQLSLFHAHWKEGAKGAR